MIRADRNPPSVVVWGLCNDGWRQNPPALPICETYVGGGEEVGPNRLCSYASNSLIKTPERDRQGRIDGHHRSKMNISEPGNPGTLEGIG